MHTHFTDKKAQVLRVVYYEDQLAFVTREFYKFCTSNQRSFTSVIYLQHNEHVEYFTKFLINLTKSKSMRHNLVHHPGGFTLGITITKE